MALALLVAAVVSVKLYIMIPGGWGDSFLKMLLQNLFKQLSA